MIRTVIFVICYLIHSSATENNGSIEEGRFIHPRGSILQFAIGVAVPCNVPKRIVAANYGIMINYVLPDNLTQLLQPVEFVKRSHHQDNFINRLFHEFTASNYREVFMGKTLCFLENQKHLKGKLIYDFLRLFFRRLDHVSLKKGLERPNVECESLDSTYRTFNNLIESLGP